VPFAVHRQFRRWARGTEPLQGTNGPFSSTAVSLYRGLPAERRVFPDRPKPTRSRGTGDAEPGVRARGVSAMVCAAGAMGEADVHRDDDLRSRCRLSRTTAPSANQTGSPPSSNAVRTFGSQQFLDGRLLRPPSSARTAAPKRPNRMARSCVARRVCRPRPSTTDAACTSSITVANGLRDHERAAAMRCRKFRVADHRHHEPRCLPITGRCPCRRCTDASTGTCQPLISPNAHFAVGRTTAAIDIRDRFESSRDPVAP